MATPRSVVERAPAVLNPCCRPQARCARRHVERARPEHYPVVGGALLWTLRKRGSARDGRRRSQRMDRGYGTLSGFMISEGLWPSLDAGVRTSAVANVVIVGNGMAAARLVDELTKTAWDATAIDVIGNEPGLPITACCCRRCSRARPLERD